MNKRTAISKLVRLILVSVLLALTLVALPPDMATASQQGGEGAASGTKAGQSEQVLDSSANVHFQPTDLSGSYLVSHTPEPVTVGITNTLCFTTYFNTTNDREYGDAFTVTVPSGWNIDSIYHTDPNSGLPGVSTTEGWTGDTVWWSNSAGVCSSNGAWVGNVAFCVDAFVPSCNAEPWSLSWEIAGDCFGGAPHFVSGVYDSVSCHGAEIGDLVWRDLDFDGIQDGGEPGVSGVSVDLFTSGNSLVSSTTTAADGSYLFVDLPPDDYYLDFLLPAGFTYTLQNQGGDDTLDSDADQVTGETGITTLGAAEVDSSWDTGLFGLFSLGDRVWNDNDRDGIQDASEGGVQNVTVSLFDNGTCAGSAIDSTITGIDGAYGFTELISDTYCLEFSNVPAGWSISPQDQGADDAADSDADALGQITNIVLSGGDSDQDMGLYAAAEIGDFVWDDVNGNGLQDGGETGIAGAAVNLYDSTDTLTDTTTTNASGYYTFTDLIPGDYSVGFVLPAGYVFSPQDQGVGDSLDSDANTATGRTATTTLDPTENDHTWDAGMYQPVSTGNLVWNDLDQDGIQDGGGEVGVSGVVVNLWTGDGGSQLDATTTDSSGLYTFTQLAPGDYLIEFALPAGYQFSSQDQGADDALDSDADTATGRTISTTLSPGENDLTWDAGLIQLAGIGNFVWQDMDADGEQDGGEPGLPGVTVELYSWPAATLVVSTTTDVNGNYAFSNQTPGDYYLKFVAPAGYLFSLPDLVADSIDSDANPITGETISTTLVPGESDLSWDAGLFQLAEIGDRVWEDLDADGVQDGGELGISNVTVNLRWGDGSGPLASVTTNAAGNYTFTVPPGDYLVEFVLPAGYVFSPQDQGADDNLDSDADTGAGRTISTTLTSGQTDHSWDAGLYQMLAIGDYVWADQDSDGIQGRGEAGFDGVTVELYTCDSTFVVSTTTAAGGFYTFTNRAPGSYYLMFKAPAAYLFSPQDQGADDAVDSDAAPITGQTDCTTFTSGRSDPDWDAGLYLPAAIGDWVWTDANRDGIQDGSESGMPGVTVRLYDGSGSSLVNSLVTGASGYYSFTQLVPGDYLLEFVLPASGYVFALQGQGGDDSLDSDADINTGRTISTTLSMGEVDLAWDAGLVPVYDLGDLVWNDTDKDGIQDGSESGYQGINVDLYDNGACAGAAIISDTTDVNGLYGFSGLYSATYCLHFTNVPAGWFTSPQDQGVDDALDSDADRAAAQITNINLTAADVTQDMGIYAETAIGDLVWNDLNYNGIQEGGEPGIQGVTVTLYTGGAAFVANTTTDASGIYTFTGLAVGDYFLQFELPSGYSFSPANLGVDDSVDSDANPFNGRTAVTSLTSLEDDRTWDAGMYRPAAMGDYVWVDLDEDGIQDGGESGIQSITVNLYQCDDTFQTSAMTNASGAYSFTNLVPGDYYVIFVLPGGLYDTFSPQDQGADDTIDSDANPITGRTACTTLSSDEYDDSWDAGMFNTNEQPVALDNSGSGFQTDEAAAFTTADVLANDSDPDPLDTLSVAGFDASGVAGLLTGNGDGTFDYDPNGQFEWLAAGEQAYEVFAYIATDGVLTDTAVVTITVTGLNDGPVAGDDRDAGFVTDEDTAFTTADVLANDTDTDGSDTLSVAAFDASGVVGLLASNGDGTFDYDPNGQFEWLAAGAQAFEVFTYTLSDGVLADTAVVTLTVNGVNDPPTISDIPDQTGIENTLVGPITFTIGDVDNAIGDLSVAAAVSDPAIVPPGNLVLAGTGISRTVTITPVLAGTAVVTITVDDGLAAGFDVFTLTVAVDEYLIYLPLVMNNFAPPVPAPDLVVRAILPGATTVQVVLENQGNATVNDAFWVDVYVDPDPVPTAVNQRWDDLCDEGVAWAVTASLLPGEAITLTVGDQYYDPLRSWVDWPLPAGAAIFAQVDSYDAGSAHGAILENHEMEGGLYNNIAGPVLVPAGRASSLVWPLLTKWTPW